MIVHCLYCVRNFSENIIGIYSTEEKAKEILDKVKEIQARRLKSEFLSYFSCEFYIIQKELDFDHISSLEENYDYLKKMGFKPSNSFYVLSTIHPDAGKNVIGVFSHKHELNNAINAYKDKSPFFVSTGGTFEEKEIEVNKI